MSDRIRSILRMIENDLYLFLRFSSNTVLTAICKRFQLDRDQINALYKLETLAKNNLRNFFETEYMSLVQINPDANPFQKLRRAAAHQTENTQQKLKKDYAQLLHG